MRSYRYTARGPPKALCAYVWVSAAHASPAQREVVPLGPWSHGPQLPAQSCHWAVGQVEVISPPRAPGASVTCSQPVGGATGTSLPVRVRVRRVGGQPDPGLGGTWGPGPASVVLGSRTGPKLACLVPSPSSGPEWADTLLTASRSLQRSGLRCRRFRSREGPVGRRLRLRGWGGGVGLRSPRRPHCSLGPIARPGSLQPHVGTGGGAAWTMVLPPARPGSASPAPDAWACKLDKRLDASSSLTRPDPPAPAAPSLTWQGENAQHCEQRTGWGHTEATSSLLMMIMQRTPLYKQFIYSKQQHRQTPYKHKGSDAETRRWLAGWLGRWGAGGGRLCFLVSGGQREAKCSSGRRGACLRPRAKGTRSSGLIQV